MNDKERELFEEHIEAVFGSYPVRTSNGQYIFDNINDMWEGWQAARKLSTTPDGWVSVDDRLPDAETDVIVTGNGYYSNAQRYDVAGLFNDDWGSHITENEVKFNVTHWMPIVAAPNTPKGE